MWFESQQQQNCAMMGLQATTGGKRKLEAATAPGDSSPPKTGRWEAEDCIARLQAVAVPSDAWRSPPPTATTATVIASSTASSTVVVDYDDDDDDFDEELSDDDRCVAAALPPPAAVTAAATTTTRFSTAFGRYHQSGGSDYWQYYQPPQQQTIRCEENGKSYLELGAAPAASVNRARCCDGRTRWCNVPCYRQRRLAVLNLSMCKLARYRQCSDPSLRRSVLICNTLRRLEREMEAEPPDQPNVYPPTAADPPPLRPTPVVSAPEPALYEQSLREMACASGRATPFPAPPPPDTDSGIGVDERPINWGSVLSLTSQTDLESLNNNDLYAELGLTSTTPDWKDTRTAEGEPWDGFVHVLVGGT